MTKKKKALKIWLKENRYSVTLFAQKLNVSRGHMSLIVNNKLKPGKFLEKCILDFTHHQINL